MGFFGGTHWENCGYLVRHWAHGGTWGFWEHGKGFGNTGEASGTQRGTRRLWGSSGNTGKTTGDTGEALGSLGSSGDMGSAASPHLSFHPLDLLLQLFRDHLPPERKGQGWGHRATPRPGAPWAPQHPPLVCLHQVNIVHANSQESSSFLDGIMALGRKTGPGLGGPQETDFG